MKVYAKEEERICEQLGFRRYIIIMYMVGLLPGRGIENLLAVLQGVRILLRSF